MTMKKLIEVYNGINKTYYCRYDLNAFGLSFKKTGKYSGKWIGKADEDKANAIKEYCIKNKLRVNITDLAYTRAHTTEKYILRTIKEFLVMEDIIIVYIVEKS